LAGLLGGAVGLLEALSFKERMENVCKDVTANAKGIEFQTVGAAMLKFREVKVSRASR